MRVLGCPSKPPSPPFAARLAYAAGSFEDIQASRPLRPSPRLPSARPRRAAHPLPRCARSRHGRRPPRSPPLRAAGAQPRAGHLRIHHGEANGPKRESAPLPGGRRVHLGSACWGGRRCASPLSGRPRGGGGRASGSNSLLVSRAAAAPFIRPLVMSFRFCIVSRPLASRGAPERHVFCCWLRARNGLFLTRNQVYYIRTSWGGHSAHVRHVRVELAVAERRLQIDSQRGVEG